MVQISYTGYNTAPGAGEGTAVDDSDSEDEDGREQQRATVAMELNQVLSVLCMPVNVLHR